MMSPKLSRADMPRSLVIEQMCQFPRCSGPWLPTDVFAVIFMFRSSRCVRYFSFSRNSARSTPLCGKCLIPHLLRRECLPGRRTRFLSRDNSGSWGKSRLLRLPSCPGLLLLLARHSRSCLCPAFNLYSACFSGSFSYYLAARSGLWVLHASR
jgi:hypothetical protein